MPNVGGLCKCQYCLLELIDSVQYIKPRAKKVYMKPQEATKKPQGYVNIYEKFNESVMIPLYIIINPHYSPFA